jgi:hypothetical protein
MKRLRFIAALSLAFGSLLFATPGQADEVTEPVVVVVTTPGGDDSSYQVPLTTTVTFDGVVYDSVYATTNSVITFGRPDGTYWDYPQTPSISLYSMDWVVYPGARADEHLIISASDGGFQVDIAARPIWLQNATEVTNINIVAAINTDGTVAISYSLSGPEYDGRTRTGVRLTSGSVVTLEQYGIVQVEEPPVLAPEPVAPTPEPTPEPSIDVIDPVIPEPIIPAPFIPEGATLLSEGSSIQVVAPEGQRILSVTAWYGDPADGSRGLEVSSVITQLASGQTSITIDSDNRYGDPAPGTVKTLIFVVNYESIPSGQSSNITEPAPVEPTPTPIPSPMETPAVSVDTPPDLQIPVEPPVSQPEPSPIPIVEPVVTPPVVEPAPQPQPIPFPVEPTPEPAPVQPLPEETQAPEMPVEEILAPALPGVPELLPEPEVTQEPAPLEEEKPLPELPIEPPIVETIEEHSITVIEDLKELEPGEMTNAQIAVLEAAVMAVFETAEQGSPAYEQALEALTVLAQADDAELPAELAAIPLLGDIAGVALEAFNAIGNIGADMSPMVREQAEDAVVASVIVGQVASAAAASAAVASSAASTRKMK